MDVNDVMHRKRMRRILGILKKVRVLPRRKTVDFRLLAEALRRVRTCWGWDRWKSQNRKNVPHFPCVEEPLNSKVIKSFVPEIRSRKCFSSFEIPMFYVYILWTFYVRFTHIRIWLWYMFLLTCLKNNVPHFPCVEEPLNSKVIKSFVPELRSRKCFSSFEIPMFYVYILWTFYVRFTHIRIWLWYMFLLTCLKNNVPHFPYVEEPLNSKVIKSFVPEIRSRKCFSCFEIPMFYVYMLWTFYVRFTQIGIWPWYMFWLTWLKNTFFETNKEILEYTRMHIISMRNESHDVHVPWVTITMSETYIYPIRSLLIQPPDFRSSFLHCFSTRNSKGRKEHIYIYIYIYIYI